jgi:hypothetical protein
VPNLTCTEMQIALGASIGIRFESLTIRCTVLNVKRAYGETRLLVTPHTGSGEQWVNLSRVVLQYGDARQAYKLPA